MKNLEELFAEFALLDDEHKALCEKQDATEEDENRTQELQNQIITLCEEIYKHPEMTEEGRDELDRYLPVVIKYTRLKN